MPRSPRLVFNGAFYHVYNRGLNKQPIFLHDDDYQFFLDKLYKLKNKFDFSIYALVILPNHFHLSVQTRKISISQIMACLGTSYSMYFNRTYHHLGPIFQNRFKSIIIENDAYFLQLSQYIYLNPVRAGLTINPLDYPYSSLGEALGKQPLRFLDEDIKRLVGETADSQRSFEKFIFEGIDNNFSELEKLFSEEEAILGTPAFLTRSLKRQMKRLKKRSSLDYHNK
ncbi:transposase [Candidatus Gottesmanbacteria bacterium]|nr:transposase [Candidatus Gottesmanbacteria bacterium]